MIKTEDKYSIILYSAISKNVLNLFILQVKLYANQQSSPPPTPVYLSYLHLNLALSLSQIFETSFDFLPNLSSCISHHMRFV